MKEKTLNYSRLLVVIALISAMILSPFFAIKASAATKYKTHPEYTTDAKIPSSVKGYDGVYDSDSGTSQDVLDYYPITTSGFESYQIDLYNEYAGYYWTEDDFMELINFYNNNSEDLINNYTYYYQDLGFGEYSATCFAGRRLANEVEAVQLFVNDYYS